jgi:hypothetical protein
MVFFPASLSPELGLDEGLPRRVNLQMTNYPARMAQAILLVAATLLIRPALAQDTTHIDPRNVDWAGLLNTGLRLDSVLKRDSVLKGARAADSAAKAAGRLLKAVTVTGKKALYDVMPDRTVINVESSITSTGGSVLDVLERAPGITVDRQNGVIDMNGKTGVVLMVNDKILRIPMDAAIQLLSGMNAGSVGKVELITTPPANYDAQGNAGFINIVLKKDTRFGTNGNFSATLGRTNGYLASGSLDFNHRQEKLNLYGNLSYSNTNAGQDWSFYHTTTDAGVTTTTNTSVPRHYYIGNCTGNLGLDYQADGKTILGAQVSGYGFANLVGIRSFNTGVITQNGQVDSTLKLFDNELHNTYNVDVNLNLEHQFNPVAKFVANLDYLHWLDDNPISYLDSGFGGAGKFAYDRPLNSHKHTTIDTWVLQLDFDRRLGKKMDLQTGVKGTLSTFSNRVEVDSLSGITWTPEPTLSGNSHLQEDYPAAYVSLKADPDDKTSFTLGLRYEFTYTRLGTDSVEDLALHLYGDLFPTITFSRKLNSVNGFDLTYSRRITRPTFNDMAPFILYIDPYTYFGGDPGLLPAIADNVGLQYHYRNYSLTLGYSYERNSIADFFPSVDSVNHIETLSAVNLQYAKTASALLTVPIRVTGWYNFSVAASATWQQQEAIYNGALVRVGGPSFKLQSTQEFSLPKGFAAEVSGYYQTSGFFYFFRSTGYGSLNLGLHKQLGSGGRLTVNADNILNSMEQTVTVNQPAQNLVTGAHLVFEYPVVRVTYTRSFGNGEVKARRERSTGSEDEQGRVHN